ncbi:MAG: betaine--homocysteine S-methyltransferase [Alphaproteobacteria bacterium]|nr:betaine--homocysteine S-methyltransferase [Alphaproteobacteria bacterium]
MSTLLETLLKERRVLLADGATGTNLFAIGLPHGEAPELWNLDEPRQVRAHYRSFIAAGSDIVLTNTFGGTANRLKLHGLDDRVHEINRLAAELLGEEIARSGRKVVLAGSVGPTGDLFQPLGPLSHADGVASFAAQMAGLKDGAADVAWIETMSSEDELLAALEAARDVGLKACCTLSFDTNGRTMMGITPSRLVEIIAGLEDKPVGYGGNCGTGAQDLLAGLLSMHDKTGAGDILIAKANCGIPEYIDGAIRYNGTPELMADFAQLARDLGARIIGGCCGTSAEHVRAMREALDEGERGAVPDLAAIVEKVGALTGSTADLFAAPGEEKPGSRRGKRPRRG